ncbi:MAG: hypothetical protein ACLFR0_05880 [Alphaproteobacteria bacterium]
MKASGHRDLFDQVRGSTQKIEPKFPAAALLDESGQKVQPEILFSPDDRDVEKYRHNLGCPCCDARLKWTPAQEKVMGSRPRKGFFSSFNLEDHKGCDLASGDDKLSLKTRNRLEFFSQSGPKILYWNIAYKHLSPIFKEAASPLKDITPVIQTALEESDAPITYQIGSMDEFLDLAKHRGFQDEFWNDVIIYNEERRVPWHDFVFLEGQREFLDTVLEAAEQGARQPKVVKVDIAPIQKGDIMIGPYRPGIRVAFDQDRHLFTLECTPEALSADKGSKIVGEFSSQIIVQTHSYDVFHALIDASLSDEVLILHGVASTSPKEIQNVRYRWPEGEWPNNHLRSYLYLSAAKDIALSPKLSAKRVKTYNYDPDIN